MRDHILRAISAILITLCFSLFPVAHAVEIDQVVVFGDSLSDNGNIYSFTRKAHRVFPKVPVIPKDPPYYQGRFTNGPVWIEDLAAALNVPLVDYAYGGAWAEPIKDSKLVVPFGIGMQVSYYLVAYATDFHKDKHLYVIWAGGNDYVEGRDDPEYATNSSVDSIDSQIEWLIYYKAKNILIMNLPDLSIVPEVTAKGPDRILAVKKLVLLHNEKLAKMVAAKQKKFPDANIIFGDITPHFVEIYEHPEKYNIKDVKTPCYTGDYSLRSFTAQMEITAAKEQNIDIMHSPSLRTAFATAKLVESGIEPCDAPDQHLFWDQIHPTSVLHNLMALDALTILSKNDIHGVPISH